MALSVFLLDNLNAFSFNMIVISALDVLSFFALFILCLPFPDMIRRTYCTYIIKGMGIFAIFMVFCAYNAVATFFKLSRNINMFHADGAPGKRSDPRMFFKRIAKNQRDFVLCILGIALSIMTLLLSAQMRRMKIDPDYKPEEEEKPEEKPKEKSASEKKNDCYVCLNNQSILYTG